jgi:serine/threonine-protein kinase
VALAAGTRIGPYEIAVPIGAGGMGEVYRATDTNLNRDVAIKVLPEAVAGDDDRLARFQREARLLAALNHPNIAQVHGLEISHGTAALVMELVEGPTLADRIAQGPIPAAEALAIAQQIALALEAAHEQGIVHRDLKPANVKVRPDGTVKVLDFGLAKESETATVAAPANATRSPTVTTPALTHAGVILGTAAYMSPEQARGRPVDKRTDIWAWGCVLYEMLTAQRAFPGSEVADVLGAVIHREPDWTALPKTLPPVLDRFLRRCLQKAPGERVRDMGDLRLALAGAFEVETSSRASGRSAVFAWVAAALALSALGAAVGVWNLRPAQARPVGRFAHVLPVGQTQRPTVAMAPDGSSVVYVANNRLYRRAMNALEAMPIRGTEGQPNGPFFSPDGQTVAYWDRLAEQVMVVSAAGGTPVALASASSFYSGSWGADDTIVFAQENGVWRVPAGGGVPQHLVKIEAGERVHGPQMLPDGNSLLFALVNVRSMSGNATAWDGAQIVVHSLDTGERTTLVRGSDPRYVPTGHLICALGNTLLAVRFDPARRAIAGRPVPIVEGVQRPQRAPGSSGSANYDFSRDGTLAYVALDESSLRPQQRMLVAVDFTGRTTPLIDEPRQYWRPRIAPDGTRVVVEVDAAGSDGAQLWIVDLARRLATPLTGENEDTPFPAWTSDSQLVVYRSNRGGRLGIYRLPADGSSDPELLLETVVETVPTDVSRDGVLAFAYGPQTGERSIRLLDLARLSASDFLATPALEHMAVFSPDGKWIAYASNESGRMEVYVRAYPPAQGVSRRVSLGGGDGPVWAPDGRTLYYRGAGDLMAVPITLTPAFSVGRPRTLFRFTGTFVPSGNTAAYDIHPDGTRFIMVTEDPEQTPPVRQIHIVQGWFNELTRLVPVE